MVIILFLLWLDLKNKEKKSKNQKKIKELDSFDYLVVFALFHTLWHSHKTGNGIIAMWLWIGTDSGNGKKSRP